MEYNYLVTDVSGDRVDITLSYCVIMDLERYISRLKKISYGCDFSDCKLITH